MIILYLFLAIIVLMFMVLIHELGHYVVGKKLGFKINEFSIGFGKVLWQKVNSKGEKISLRIFPLGGYCAFYGEDDTDDAKDKEIKKDDPDYFTNKHPFKRILVFLAGVAFNFISAIIFSFILLVSFGYGNVYMVTSINPYFQAEYENTGLALIDKNDKILKIDGQRIDFIWGATLENLTVMEENNSYTLTIQKSETNEIIDIEVIVQTNFQLVYDEETGEIVYDEVTGEPKIALDDENNQISVTGIGFSIALTSQPVSFIEALSQCFSFTIGLVWMVLKTLWLLITFQLPLSALGGTLTVISTVATTLQQSFSALFIYLPLIAANLAVFNLLPFPALDGSHIAFTTIEWIRGKPINRNVESIIHFIGFTILIGFVILVDLIHFLG